MAPKKPNPSDVKTANCVLKKFKACVDEALLDGKSLDRALQGCAKNITTFQLLCQKAAPPKPT
jgi:hypothetical protein